MRRRALLRRHGEKELHWFAPERAGNRAARAYFLAGLLKTGKVVILACVFHRVVPLGPRAGDGRIPPGSDTVDRLCFPAFCADEGHKADRAQVFFQVVGRPGARQAEQFLSCAAEADRHYQAPANCKLLLK